MSPSTTSASLRKGRRTILSLALAPVEYHRQKIAIRLGSVLDLCRKCGFKGGAHLKQELLGERPAYDLEADG